MLNLTMDRKRGYSLEAGDVAIVTKVIMTFPLDIRRGKKMIRMLLLACCCFYPALSAAMDWRNGESDSEQVDAYWRNLSIASSSIELKQSRFAGYVEGKFSVRVPDWWVFRLNALYLYGDEADSQFEPTKRAFEIRENESRCEILFNSERSRFELPVDSFGFVRGHSTDCILLPDGCALVSTFSDTQTIKLFRLDKSSNVEWIKSISFRTEYGGTSGPCIPETLELVKSVDSMLLFVARRGTSYIYRIDPKTGEELCSGNFTQLDSRERE